MRMSNDLDSLIRVRRSTSGVDECGVDCVVFVILLFATMLLRPQYCMLYVFAVYSVNDVQVKFVINKNPREVVL